MRQSQKTPATLADPLKDPLKRGVSKIPLKTLLCFSLVFFPCVLPLCFSRVFPPSFSIKLSLVFSVELYLAFPTVTVGSENYTTEGFPPMGGILLQGLILLWGEISQGTRLVR